MKIYDTNLSKFDSMALKTCLLFYLFANCEPDKVSTYLELPSIKIILLFSDGLGYLKPNIFGFWRSAF